MRVAVDRKRLSYPDVGKPDNVAYGPGSLVSVRTFQSPAR